MKEQDKPFDREKAEADARRRMQESDRRREAEARAKFITLSGLNDAIVRDILPALVTIETIGGRVGSGYYHYGEWLLSNAHVLPHKVFVDGMRLLDYQGNVKSFTVIESYHRPVRQAAPDIAIISNTPGTPIKSLGYPLTEKQKKAWEHEPSCFFYIQLLGNSQQRYFRIKFLMPLKNIIDDQRIYQCVDGTSPKPGSSGTPIIQARVLPGHEPTWKFRVVGALYARCHTSWYNSRVKLDRYKVPQHVKLVCSIPVAQEFLQILKILYKISKAERLGEMSFASELLKDINNAKKYKLSQEETEEMAKLLES